MFACANTIKTKQTETVVWFWQPRYLHDSWVFQYDQIYNGLAVYWQSLSLQSIAFVILEVNRVAEEFWNESTIMHFDAIQKKFGFTFNIFAIWMIALMNISLYGT